MSLFFTQQSNKSSALELNQNLRGCLYDPGLPERACRRTGGKTKGGKYKNYPNDDLIDRPICNFLVLIYFPEFVSTEGGGLLFNNLADFKVQTARPKN